MAKLPAFILVMAVSQLGRFRRCGLAFDRTWRAVQIGDHNDLVAPIPMVDAEGYARLKADSEPRQIWPREGHSPPMIAIKPATAEEIAEYRNTIAETAGKDVGDLLESERAKRVELEARLMKLELAPRDSKPDPKLAEENADLRARLAQLEKMVQAALGAPTGDAGAATAPASPPPPAADKPAKPASK